MLLSPQLINYYFVVCLLQLCYGCLPLCRVVCRVVGAYNNMKCYDVRVNFCCLATFYHIV